MTRKKRLITVLLIVWGVPLALALGIGAWVSYAGTISVNVDERGPGGDHVHVKVPAAFVDMVLAFVPETIRCGDSASFTANDMNKWMPFIENLRGELDSIEDGVLVQVTGAEDNVLIAKKGRNMVVDCKSADETVHIVMPVRTLSSVLAKCGSLRGHARCRAVESSGA